MYLSQNNNAAPVWPVVRDVGQVSGGVQHAGGAGAPGNKPVGATHPISGPDAGGLENLLVALTTGVGGNGMLCTKL